MIVSNPNRKFAMHLCPLLLLVVVVLVMVLLASALVAANSSSIRGTSVIQSQREQDEPSNRRRHLLQNSECTLYQKCATYEPTEDHPNGYHEDTWACKLSKEDSERLDVEFVDLFQSNAVAAAIANANATSGETTLTISRAVLDIDSPQIYVPEDAHIEVRSIPVDLLTRAHEQVASTGLKTVLMIRITDKNGVAPDANAADLHDGLFDDEQICLKTQMEACSSGKVKIEPFVGRTPTNQYINNGIVEIKVDDMASSEKKFAQMAKAVAKAQLGDFEDPRFGIVMFCLPQGTGSIAFAYPRTKYSFYSNQWCTAVAANMHEIGHGFGLGHSGTPEGGKYGDRTGVMGSNPGKDPIEMCYNAQKSYQLNWYKDQTKTIDPLHKRGSSRRQFVLNGVSDYKKNLESLIVLRLDQVSKDQDYYVGFNRAEGINKDTGEDRNMITIIHKESGGPSDYSTSSKVAALEPGQKYVIENFNGVKDVTVEFSQLEDGDATILVCPGRVCPAGREKPCNDRARGKIRIKRRSPPKKCKHLARKRQCNKMVFSGKWKVWQLCQKSCGKCSNDKNITASITEKLPQDTKYL